MSKKAFICEILVVLVITSCGNQLSSSLPRTPSPIEGMTSYVPGPTQTPGIVITTTATVVPEPDQSVNIFGNALIAFIGDQSINLIPAIGGSPSVVLQSRSVVQYHSPSWSPSGDQLVFGSEGDGVTPKINVVNRDGSSLRVLRNNAGFDPVWSPDGEYIAYASSNGLYIMSVDGSGLQQLAGPKSSGGLFPAWSPDGKKLALLGDSKGYDGPLKIFLIDSNGDNLHSITDAVAGWSHLSWSPDGSKIAFRSFEDCGDISVIDLKTEVITDLTDTLGIVEVDPAWSPDGNYIAFSRAFYSPCGQDKVYSYGGDNIYIMKADGQDVTQLMNANGYQPSWWPTVILRPNWKYSVTKTGSNLNVRESPVKSAKSLAVLAQGAIFAVLDGPQQSDGYSWWHIRSDSGIEGWCVDVPGWFMFESTGETAP